MVSIGCRNKQQTWTHSGFYVVKAMEDDDWWMMINIFMMIIFKKDKGAELLLPDRPGSLPHQRPGKSIAGPNSLEDDQ